MLEDLDNERYRHIIEDDIAFEKRLRIIVGVVGEPKDRRR